MTKVYVENEDGVHEESWPPPHCPECGGELIPLGVLGRLLHSRCRRCGIQTSTEIEIGPERGLLGDG